MTDDVGKLAEAQTVMEAIIAGIGADDTAAGQALEIVHKLEAVGYTIGFKSADSRLPTKGEIQRALFETPAGESMAESVLALLPASYSPPNVNYWGDRCCRAEAMLRELVAAIDKKWGGESDRRRANALSPRIEEALEKARSVIVE